MNGVDVNELKSACEILKEKPELARSQFRVENKWDDGGHNRVSIKGYYTLGEEQETRKEAVELDADEPPELLGGGQGANPVEYLLTALSSCMTTSIVYHAAARGIKIESLESSFEGDLDLQGFLGLRDGVRPGYQQIRVTFRVKTDASKEEIEPLYKFSPVYDVVSRSVPVDVQIEVVK
jgi:uncharacterized OsmC-like protein